MGATYAAALMAVACFAIAFDRLGVASVARRAMASGVDAARVMRARVVSDDEKERAVRAASRVLIRCFGSIALRGTAALGVSLLPLLVLDVAGWVRVSAVNRLLTSWNGIVLASATVAALYFMRPRH